RPAAAAGCRLGKPLHESTVDSRQSTVRTQAPLTSHYSQPSILNSQLPSSGHGVGVFLDEAVLERLDGRGERFLGGFLELAGRDDRGEDVGVLALQELVEPR